MMAMTAMGMSALHLEAAGLKLMQSRKIPWRNAMEQTMRIDLFLQSPSGLRKENMWLSAACCYHTKGKFPFVGLFRMYCRLWLD